MEDTLAHLLCQVDRSLTAAGPDGLRVSSLARVGRYFTRSREVLHTLQPPQAGIALVVEGRKTVYGPGSAEVFEPGQQILFPAGLPITVINEPNPGSGLYRALVLEFQASLLERFRAAYPDLVRQALEAPAPCRSIGLKTTPGLAEAVVQVLRAAAQPSETLAAHRLMEVLLVMAEAGRLADILAGHAGSLADRVCGLVRLDPAADWSSARLADALGTSTATLNRRLREAGTTAHALVEQVRLMHAAGLLSEDGAEVSEVAWRVGYQSPSRFAASFKRRYGLTPSQVIRSGASLSAPGAPAA